MSETKDSSVVTRLLENAQQRPIEANFGESAKPIEPLARHRAPAGSIAPPLSALTNVPVTGPAPMPPAPRTPTARLAPPALPRTITKPQKPVPRITAAAPVDLDDGDFEEEIKTSEIEPAMIVAAAPALPAVPAIHPAERGLEEMAARRPLTEDTNPGRRSRRQPVSSPYMEPSPSVIVAPALVTPPAHSQQVLAAISHAEVAPPQTDLAVAAPVPPAAPVVTAPRAEAHAAWQSVHQSYSLDQSGGTGVRMPTVRVRRATPWIAIGAATLVAGALGAFMAMQADKNILPKPTAKVAPSLTAPVVTSASSATDGAAVAPVTPVPQIAVNIDSIPAGASVELIEGNTVKVLGVTPLTAQFADSEAPTLTLRREGFAPMTKTLAPRTERAWSAQLVALAQPVAPPTNAVAFTSLQPAMAPQELATASQAPATSTKVRVAPSTASKPASHATARIMSTPAAATPMATGPGRKGMLSLGAKPPCDIYVDGKNTGLTTPQRDLVLTAGSHKITLVNKEFKIRESFSVQVKAGSESRVVKDYSKQIKK